MAETPSKNSKGKAALEAEAAVFEAEAAVFVAGARLNDAKLSYRKAAVRFEEFKSKNHRDIENEVERTQTGACLSDVKEDVETLIEFVTQWRRFGYTEDETRRFYEAVVNNLSHLITK